MTKVKELIKDSVFIKADGFDALKPELSIFLPTFKRGDNGLFERALKSILNQKFKNFELIIIDDASVDSTASIYKRYMQKDARIAVIRHQKNLGLSAVSTIEGFLAARGQKYLCAFDDNVFHADGINLLMQDQKKHPDHLITYGQVQLYLNDKEHIILGNEPVEYQKLLSGNMLGHSTVLVDKRVHDEIGFYDPHFAIMRFWDWDLWLRASQRFSFYKIDAVIVEEYGVTQPDSLGNTVNYDDVVLNIWLQRYRNRQLARENIQEYEFDALPPYTGNYFKVTLTDIIQKRFGNKYPLKPVWNDNGFILLVAYAYIVSLSIAFDVFSDRIVFADFHNFKKSFYKYILDAKAVVFCRDIPDPDILNRLKYLKKDYYYFTDDNLFIIPEFQPTHGTKFAHEFFAGAKGFIGTTPNLVDELKQRFGKEVAMITCIRPKYLEDGYKSDFSKYDKIGNTIRIGWCSTGKEEGLIAMKDDLIRLARKQNKKLEFFCFSTPESEKKLKKAFAGTAKIKFIFNGLDFCYTHLLNKMRDFNPHFLIHTHGGMWSYIYKYKTYNYLITAWYLNAIPFITVRPPYDLLQDDKLVGKLIVKDGHEVVSEIEKYLTMDKSEIVKTMENIDTFLNKEYPITHNQRVLMDLYQKNTNISLQTVFESLSNLRLETFFDILVKNDDVPEETLLNKFYKEKHNLKRLRKVISKTFTYYFKGKPYKYKYPVKYNLKNLRKEFKAVWRHYCNKFLKK